MYRPNLMTIPCATLGTYTRPIGFHWIESVQTIVVQELSAKPSLRRRRAIIDAVHRGEAESPVHVIPLHGVRKALNAHYGLVELKFVGDDGVRFRNV